jgi:hypothetical protein
MEVEEILKDGDALFHYSRKTIGVRNPRLWRRFEYICLSEGLIRVEGLFQALSLLPSFMELKLLANIRGRPYSVVDHLERCIKAWVYYCTVKAKNLEHALKNRRTFVYYTGDGRIRVIYANMLIK